MNKHIIASPNWYNGSISDVSADGIFAFGAKNTIYLIDLAAADNGSFLGQLCGHKDRVTSIRFCKTSAYSRLCVSGSEDHFVAIWDVDGQVTVNKHGKHQVSFKTFRELSPFPYLESVYPKLEGDESK